MGRIRTIKPEFPQSETIGRLSRDARLLFVQLWTIVDDSGRARANSRMLASLLYPYDDDAPSLIESWLDELERKGCVRRYEVDDDHYLDIPNWLKHQKVDHPTASRLPECVAKPREKSRKLAPDLGPRTLDLGPVSKEGANAPSSSSPIDDLGEALRLWNSELAGLPLAKVQRLTDVRRKKLTLRLHDLGGIDGWRDMLAKIRASPHLRGENGWRVFFDWVLDPAHLTKIMEGNYDDRKPTRKLADGETSADVLAILKRRREGRERNAGEGAEGPEIIGPGE